MILLCGGRYGFEIIVSRTSELGQCYSENVFQISRFRSSLSRAAPRVLAKERIEARSCSSESTVTESVKHVRGRHFHNELCTNIYHLVKG